MVRFFLFFIFVGLYPRANVLDFLDTQLACLVGTGHARVRFVERRLDLALCVTCLRNVLDVVIFSSITSRHEPTRRYHQRPSRVTGVTGVTSCDILPSTQRILLLPRGATRRYHQRPSLATSCDLNTLGSATCHAAVPSTAITCHVM